MESACSGEASTAKTTPPTETPACICIMYYDAMQAYRTASSLLSHVCSSPCARSILLPGRREDCNYREVRTTAVLPHRQFCHIMMMISLANLPFLLISQYQYNTIRIDLVVECYYHATIHERLCHVCAACLRLLLLLPSHVLPDLFPAVGGARGTVTRRGTARSRIGPTGLASLNSHYRLTASRTCSAYKTNVRDCFVRLNRFPFPARLNLLESGARTASQLLFYAGCHMSAAASRHPHIANHVKWRSTGHCARRTSPTPDNAASHRELKTENALPIISVPANGLDRPRLIGSLLERSRNIHCN